MGGKADKWFRGLLGLRNSASPQSPPSRSRKENRRWSCVKSYREKDDEDHHHHHHNTAKLGRSKTEVAAATKAAVAVVRLTRSRRSGNVKSASYGGESYWLRREWWAAVKLQSAFRGYLARKALRALKGLVRLQALVRGHIERKRTTQWLLRMQALLRAQAKAIAGRSQFSGPAHFNSKDPTAHKTSMSPLRPSWELKEAQFYNNSPKFISRGPLTPSKSDGSRSHLSGYSDQNPNYMSYTESSKAKLRSLSAPKQRLNFHRSGSNKRNSVHEFGESRSSSLHGDFITRVDYTAWNACRI